jgi:monoamine oxidase
MTRRAALGVLSSPVAASARPPQARSGKVIVAGAGIAGLCCAYELRRRGLEVVVLEAAGRPGGHILTVRDGLADALYADAGAEHFYRPGYDQLWKYIDEFQLPVIAYPRRRNLLRPIHGRLYTSADLESPARLKEAGYNQREIRYIAEHSLQNLPGLYFEKYVERFPDEDHPFSAGLDALDSITGKDFLRKEGASEAAASSLGGSRSALQVVWHAAIRRKRRMNWLELNLFRIRGGNQRLTDAFAARLREQIRLGCPVTAMEHAKHGVRVSYSDNGRGKVEEADHLVTCMPLPVLRRIPVTPAWPPPKRYVIDNMPHDSHCRVIFQTRTRFWKKDGVSPNINLGDFSLGSIWEMADEVPTARGILIGTAGITTPEKALAAYRRVYPGTSEDIEISKVVNWINDPWAMSCLPTGLPPGELRKYWPAVREPVGPIHFAGVYADNYPFGMEGAIRSAQHVVSEITGDPATKPHE